MLAVGVVASLVLATVFSHVQEASSQASGQSCDSCTRAVSHLGLFLKNNATKAEIEIVLRELCVTLKDDLQEKCEDDVQQLVDQILLHKLQQDQVCAALGLCSANKSVPIYEIQPPSPNDIQCDLCKIAIDKVKSMLGKKATKDQIVAALGKVCRLLPRLYRSKCEKFIKKYGPKIVELLISGFSSKQICNTLGLCSTNVEVPIYEIQPPNPDDIQCDLCKIVIDKVKSMLGENATKDQIVTALSKVCSLLPPLYKSKCETLIKEYVPQFVELLISGLSTQEICNELRLCSTDMKVPIYEIQPPNPDDIQCDLCKIVIDKVKSMLGENATKDQIVTALSKVCSLLPPLYKSKCETLIKEYVPQFVELLISGLSTQEICNELRLCSTDMKVPIYEIQPPNPDDIQCDLCKIAIDKVKSMLGENATKDQIVTALSKVCSLLPPLYKSKCETLIKEYVPQFVELLISGFSTQEICNELRLCSTDMKVPIYEIQPPNPDDIQCDLCKIAIDKVKSMLGENATKDQIVAALSKVCSLLSPLSKSKCEKFTKKYGPQLVQLLISGLSSDQICRTLGICSTDVGVPVYEIQPPSSDGINCKLCKMTINVVKSMLKKNATRDQIKVALSKVCSMLPPILRSQCKQFVNKYGQQLTQMLIDSLSANQICKKLQLCTADMEVDSSIYRVPPCVLCDYIMKYMDIKLPKNATQTEIDTTLDFVCNILPSTLKPDCYSFIVQNKQVIVSLLKMNNRNHEVCVASGICINTIIRASVNDMQQPNPEFIPCNLCKQVIDKLKSILSDKATQSEIKQALEQLCNLVPQVFRDQCTKFIDTYEEQIIQNFLSVFTSEQICSVLRLCSTGMEVPGTSESLTFVPENKEPKSMIESEGKCALCKMLAEMIDHYIQKENIVDEVEKILGQVCFIAVPDEMRTQCLSIVKEYTSALVELVSQLNNPTAVCEGVHVCARPSEEIVFTDN